MLWHTKDFLLNWRTIQTTYFLIRTTSFLIKTTTFLIKTTSFLIIYCCDSSQSVLEVGPCHCPNGHLGQDLGFGEFAFSLKLPEWLNTNLVTVRAKLGQTSSFPKGPKFGSQ